MENRASGGLRGFLRSGRVSLPVEDDVQSGLPVVRHAQGAEGQCGHLEDESVEGWRLDGAAAGADLAASFGANINLSGSSLYKLTHLFYC